MLLTGQVAVITGGGRGIGRAIALKFAREGAAVVVAARTKSEIEAVAKEIRDAGGRAAAVPGDVADEKFCDHLIRVSEAEFGRVDILVNNAGLTDGGPLTEMSVETWDKVMAANLRGPFLCTRSAMRIMKAQGGGRILNIGSISAQRPRLNSAPYATSKFGLWGLTVVTALEGRELGISACCLHPGNVSVEGSAQELGDLTGIPDYASEPKMKAEEIAEVATLMACLPPHMNMLEAIVLPVKQAYLGRG